MYMTFTSTAVVDPMEVAMWKSVLPLTHLHGKKFQTVNILTDGSAVKSLPRCKVCLLCRTFTAAKTLARADCAARGVSYLQWNPSDMDTPGPLNVS